MRKIGIVGWGLALALAAAAVQAAPADNTSGQYFTTPAGNGFPIGVVVQQSPDGSTASPINSAHPLPTSQAPTANDGTPYQTILVPRNTYYVYVTGYAAYSTPTVLAALCGSPTKKVEVATFQWFVQSTTAGFNIFTFNQRSSAYTPATGSPSTPTVRKMDTSMPAATAAVTQFGAAPTTGTLDHLLWTAYGTSGLLTATPGTIFLGNPFTTLGVLQQSNVRLNSASECLEANYGGAALTGTSGWVAAYLIVWTEF